MFQTPSMVYTGHNPNPSRAVGLHSATMDLKNKATIYLNGVFANRTMPLNAYSNPHNRDAHNTKGLTFLYTRCFAPDAQFPSFDFSPRSNYIDCRNWSLAVIIFARNEHALRGDLHTMGTQVRIECSGHGRKANIKYIHDCFDIWWK